MAQSAFAVHLGGGLYLDSDGSLTQGPPPTPVIYQAPFKLPIDPKKAKDAMKGVQDALKDVNKDPKILAKFAEYGFDTKILDILSGVAKIAGMIAPVLAAAAIAYDLARIFGAFKEGPSPLEVLMKERFTELETNVNSVKELIEIKNLVAIRVPIETFTADMMTYVRNLKQLNPNLQQLEADKTRNLDAYNEAKDEVGKLLDQATWIGSFDRDEHTLVWPFMASLIHTRPAGSTAPVPRPFPPDDSLQFDHRLMIPLATWAAEVFLTCVRGITPEHRSTGEFRDILRLFAKKLDGLAESMLTHSLGVTHYKPADFSGILFPQQGDIEISGSLSNLKASISPLCTRFPVGALDLRYHGDGFFGEFLRNVPAQWRGNVSASKHGGMEFRWMPPAKLAPGPFDGYVITNPDECAAAANEYAETEYAELLSVSGYTELVRLAALYRNESTEPSESQTVLAAKSQLRDPQPRTAVTVSSDPILLTGVISSPAEREPQKCLAIVSVHTQPIKRERLLEYEVKLRTLRSISANNRWSEPPYSAYQWAQYEPDGPPADHFLKMVLHQSDRALDEFLLAGGSSLREGSRDAQGIAELGAHTFDWWIPVKPPFAIDVEFVRTLAELRALGWSEAGAGGGNGSPSGTPGAQLMNIPGGTGSRRPSFADPAPHLTWKNGEQDWDGEHREPKDEMVKIEYSLTWEQDLIELRLKNDPADRNYVVYLVVEEKLGSGQILHTALPVPMNGQLTYVPQSFFDEEQEAIARLAKTFTEFNDRYSLTREVGPLDPVVGWVRPGDLYRADVLERVAQLAREYEPELLRKVLGEAQAPELVAEPVMLE